MVFRIEIKRKNSLEREFILPKKTNPQIVQLELLPFVLRFLNFEVAYEFQRVSALYSTEHNTQIQVLEQGQEY